MAEPISAPQSSAPSNSPEPAPQNPAEKISVTAPVPPMLGNTLKLSVNTPKKRDFSTVPFWLGLALSLAWIVMVATALLTSGEGSSFGGIPLANWAIGLSAIASPVALIWMITAYLQRASDVQVMTEPLRKQLNLIIGENSVAENRIKRFNNAIREQIDLLRQSSTVSEEEMVRLLRQLSWEREEVKKIAMHRMAQLHEAGKITHAAEMFDAMLANRLQQILDIEEKLRQGNGLMAKNADHMRAVLSDVLQEIKEGQKSLAQSLTVVKGDSQELRDHLRGQEVDILNAQSNMKNLLTKSEQEFEAILNRFYDRSKDAEAAMDDATASLADRIAVLEKASGVLPEKIAAAAEQLTAAIANYETIEQTAHKVAVNTGRVLDDHAAALAGKIEGFGQKLLANSNAIGEQRQALAAMLDRIAAATGDVYANLKTGADSLTAATDTSLARFETITAQVRKEAESLTEQLQQMTEQYTASAQEAGSATELHQLRMAAMQEQLTENIGLLRDYENQSAASSEAMHSRGTSILQNLKGLEDRLHTLNNTVAQVSDQTHRKLQHEAEANRSLLAQLSGAAEESAATLQRATEKLGTQHDGLIDRATRSEAQLQKLVLELAQLHEAGNSRYEQQLKTMSAGLRETTDLLRAAELQLQDFSQRSLTPVTQATAAIATAASESSASLAAFTSKLEAQAEQVASFEEKVGAASTALETAAGKSSSVIGTFLSSLFNLNRQQDELAQKTAEQFDRTSGKFNAAMAEMDKQATHIHTRLLQSSDRLNSQSQEIARTALEASEQLQQRTSEMAQQHSTQFDAYNSGLSRLEEHFTKTTQTLADAEGKLQQFGTTALEPVHHAAAKIADVAAQGSARIAAFGEAIETQAARTFAQTQQKLEQFGNAALEPVNSAAARVATITTENTDRLATFGRTLETQTAQVLEKAQEQLQQFGNAALEPVNSAAARVASITTENTERLSAFSRVLEAQTMQTLEQAQQKLQQFGGAALAPITDAASRLNDTADESLSRLTALSVALDKQAEQLQQHETGIAAANDTLAAQAARSGQSLADYIANLQELGREQESVAAQLEGSVERASKKLNNALDGIAGQTAAAIGQIEDAHDNIKSQQRSWLEETGKAETALQERLQAMRQQQNEQTGQYAEQLTQLNSSVTETTSILQNAEEKLQRFSATALEPVSRAAQLISSAAAQGESAIDSFGTKLTEQAGKLTAFEEQAKQASATLEAVSTRGNTSIGTFIANLLNLGQKQDDLTQKVEKSLQQSSAQFSTTLGQLGEQTETAANKLAAAHDKLSAQSRAFLTAAEEAELQLRDQTQAISLLHSEQNLRYAQHVATLNQNLRDTTDLLENTEQRLHSFGSDALGPINRAMTGLADKVAAGQQVVRQFAGEIAAQTDQVAQLEQRVVAANQTLESQTVKTGQTIGGFLANLFNLGQKQEALAQQVETSFERSGNKLTAAMNGLGLQTTATLAQMEQAQDKLSNQQRKWLDETGKANDTLQARLGSIQVQQTDYISQQQQQIEALDRQVQQTAATLKDAEQKLQGFSSTALEPVSRAAQQISAAATQGEASLTSFGVKLEEQAGKFTAFEAKVQQTNDTLEAATSRSNMSIGTLIANLFNLGQKQDELAQKVEQRLEATGTRLHAAMDALDSHADSASTHLLTAAENIANQGQALVDEAAIAETRLQQHSETLTQLHAEHKQQFGEHLTQIGMNLRETTDTLDQTKQRLQRFTVEALEPVQFATGRIIEAAEKGTGGIEAYANKLAERAAHIEQLNEKLTTTNGLTDSVTARSTSAVAAMLAQMTELNAQQETLAQKVETAFNNAAGKLAGEIGTLSNRATFAADTLEQAYQRMSGQNDALTSKATETAAAMNEAGSQMQSRATALQHGLETQLGHIAQQLAAFELRFTSTGDLVKQKADAAYVLMDQAGERFNSLTAELTDGITDKTVRLQDIVTRSLQQISTLGEALQERLLQIGQGQGNLQEVSAQIAAANDRIIAQLSRIHSEGLQTNRQLQDDVAATITQLGQVQTTLTVQQQALRQTADHVMDDFTRVGGGIEAQSARLGTIGETYDGQIKLMQDNLAALETRSAALRDTMSGHTAGLVSQLQQGVNQLQQMSTQLQSNVAQALQGADQAQNRFDTLAQNGLQQFQAQVQELQSMTGAVEHALGGMRGSLQQQMTALTDAVQQIAQQQGALQTMTASQRDELLGLFDKLAAAHQSSAHAAEETIARFSRATASINASLTSFSTTAESTLQTVQQAGSGFAEENQQFMTQSDEAARQVRQIMRVTEELAEHARTVTAQTESEASRLAATMAHIIDQLDGGTGSMRSHTEDLLRQINASSTAVTEQIADAVSNLQQCGDQVRSQMTVQAQALREETRHETDHMIASVNQLMEKIDSSGQTMRGRAQEILTGIEQSGDQLTQQIANLLDTVGANNEHIRAQMAAEAERVRSQAFAEADQMAAAFSQVLRDIDKSSDKLRAQADVILNQIGDQSDVIAAELASALQRFGTDSDTLRAGMSDHIAQLRNKALDEVTLYGDKLSELMSHIERSGSTIRVQQQDIAAAIDAGRSQVIDQFGNLLTQIDLKNQQVLQQLSLQSRKLRTVADDEAERFSNSLTHLLGQIDGSIGHLRFQSEDVLARIAQSGTQVKRDFAQVLSEIAESQQKIQGELTDYASGLRVQAQKDMAQIAGDISEMLERIDGTGAQLREHVLTAVGSLDLGGDALAQEVDVLLAKINDQHNAIRNRMTEHAMQMREGYAGEVARMADSLRGIMTEMAQAGVQLKAQNNDVLAGLEQSAMRFSLSAKQAAQYMTDQVGQLDSAAQQVETRLQGLGGKLQQEKAALTAASEAIGAHTVQMAAQTANAAEQLRQLLQTVGDSSTQAQGLSSHVASQLQGMIIHLREEMQRLSEHSTATAQAATHVVDQIMAGTSELRAASAQIKQEGNSLPQVVDLAEQRLTRAGTLLREQALEAANLLEGNAGKFVQVFANQQDSVANQTRQLQQVAAQAEETLRQFGQRLAEQLGQMQSGTGIVEAAQLKLVDQTAAAIAHMAVASDRLNHLREGAEAAHGQILHKIQHMEDQAQSTSKILQVGSIALGNSISQLAEVSTRAQQDMMSAGVQYRTQLEELRQGIQQQLDGLHEHVAGAALQLEQKSSVLTHVTAKAEKDIEQLLARFNVIANSSTDMVADKTGDLHKLAEEAAQLLLGFGKTIDAQLEHLASASEHIGTTQKYLSGTLDNSIRQVDVLQEKMENSRQVAQTSTAQLAEQLQKLSATLQNHIEQLGVDAQRAVGVVDTAGTNWQSQAQNLARIAQQARSELAAISYAIDALQQKGSSLRDNIQGQGQHLMQSLNDVIDHMAATQAEVISDDPLINRMERGLQKIS